MTTAMIAVASAMAAGTMSFAASSERGVARFTLPSDTIRIQGNTVFPGTDWTYELHIRLDAGLPPRGGFAIVSEQRDTFEDKSLGIVDDAFFKADTRGANCGSDPAVSPVPVNVPNHWRHLAWVRSGSSLRLYVDGLIDSEWTSTPSCTGNHPGSWMSIGMFRYGAGYIPGPIIAAFSGDLDWIRISKVARYTQEFVPPCEAELVADADTELLLRFNEGPGATVLIDESPNAWVCEPGVPVHSGAAATAPQFVWVSVTGTTACQDCDNDGISDADEIAAGAPDVNANGVPDTCECLADLNDDGVVNGADISVLLGFWGLTGKSVTGDIVPDGTVNGADLAAVLGSWGACP